MEILGIFIWEVLPFIVLIGSCILTIVLALRHRRALNYVTMTIVLFFSLLSFAILVCMFFFGMYPTYIPHLLIFISAILVTLQFVMNRFFKAKDG